SDGVATLRARCGQDDPRPHQGRDDAGVLREGYGRRDGVGGENRIALYNSKRWRVRPDEKRFVSPPAAAFLQDATGDGGIMRAAQILDSKSPAEKIEIIRRAELNLNARVGCMEALDALARFHKLIARCDAAPLRRKMEKHLSKAIG